MTITVIPCRSLADVDAIESTLPTGPSMFHRRRFQRRDGSDYLPAWQGDRAVGHILLTPTSKYAEVRSRLGGFPEVNALGVAEQVRRHVERDACTYWSKRL